MERDLDNWKRRKTGKVEKENDWKMRRKKKTRRGGNMKTGKGKNEKGEMGKKVQNKSLKT